MECQKENIDRLKGLNCDVLDIFATQRSWSIKSSGKIWKRNMAAAGKKLTVRPYDAGHAFANPSDPGHKKEFTADAYKEFIEFLKARLKYSY